VFEKKKNLGRHIVLNFLEKLKENELMFNQFGYN
jgi:hypothetical protein